MIPKARRTHQPALASEHGAHSLVLLEHAFSTIDRSLVIARERKIFPGFASARLDAGAQAYS
jgi:hypothetical protein